MTWAAIGGAAVTVVGGAVSADQNRKTSNKASDKLTDAQRAAQALNEQRYQEARNTLSPYLSSSAAANKQLMIELGLGGQYAAEEQSQRSSRLKELQDQLAKLQSQQQAQQQAVEKKKKKSGGGVLGKLSSKLSEVTGHENVNDFLNPLGSIKTSVNSAKYALSGGKSNLPGGNNTDYASSIDELQKQIAAQQAEVDKYSADPTLGKQPGTAYMNTPVYQGAIKAGTEAVNTGAAGDGALYSGARGLALRDVGQNVNQSMYSNYMNLLQNAANPATATNLSNIGINQAGNIGSQNIATTGMVNNYGLQNATDQGAFIADAAGGLSGAFTAYMNRPKTSKVAPTGASAGEPTFNPGLA